MEPYILLVEDDTILERAFKLKCAKKNISLKIIGDGYDAVSFIKTTAKKPSVVVLDLMLPGASGFEILDVLRSSPGWKSIPVLILSVLSQENDIKKAKSLGAKEYLIKSDITIDDAVEKASQYIPQK